MEAGKRPVLPEIRRRERVMSRGENRNFRAVNYSIIARVDKSHCALVKIHDTCTKRILMLPTDFSSY
jgi:hypothetical protein